MPTIEEIKARLQQLNDRTKKKANDIWKPKDEHDCRALPNPHSDDPFVELSFHYELGDVVLCPKLNFGRECAVCDFCDVLRAWRDPQGNDKPETERRADFEIFKKIQPKPVWFLAIVERGHEDNPQWMRLNKTNYEKLLSICIDKDYNDDRNDGGGTAILTSPDAGLDFHVSLKKKNNEDKKGNTKSFDVVDIVERKKTTPLLKDKKLVKELLAKIKPITSVYVEQSPEDVKKILARFLNGQSLVAESAPANRDGGTEKYPANSNERPPVGGRTIDEAFGDLLKD